MLTPYKQSDKRWGSLEIIPGMNMSVYGCAITSISILDGRTPDIILGLLHQAHAINLEGMVVWPTAAEELNFLWKGFANVAPNYPCIACTNHYAKDGYPTHFFVSKNDGKGTCFDPLDGKIKVNPYHIISYRLFTKGIKSI